MRTKHHWTVTLQRETGEIIESPFASYWDPGQEGTKEAVMASAAIEASMKTPPVRGHDGPRRVLFAPISCALKTPDAVTDEELMAGAVPTA